MTGAGSVITVHAVPLVLPVEDPCSFCAYLAGQRRYSVLEHGYLTALLVTIEQRGLGHVLAVPVEHRVTVFDLTRAEAADLMDASIRAATAIRDAYDPEGIAVWQNNGTAANQSIPHVHVHVHIAGTVPGGETRWGDVPRQTFDQTDEIAQTLRRHLPPPE